MCLLQSATSNNVYSKYHSVCTNPELDQVESILGALAEQLLQAAFLFGKLVVDLPDVDALQQRVAVAQAALADVHKQVLVELQGDGRRKARVKRTSPSHGYSKCTFRSNAKTRGKLRCETD